MILRFALLIISKLFRILKITHETSPELTYYSHLKLSLYVMMILKDNAKISPSSLSSFYFPTQMPLSISLHCWQARVTPPPLISLQGSLNAWECACVCSLMCVYFSPLGLSSVGCHVSLYYMPQGNKTSSDLVFDSCKADQSCWATVVGLFKNRNRSKLQPNWVWLQLQNVGMLCKKCK